MSLQETANAETPSPDLSSLPATAFPEGADPSTYAASLKADPNAEQEASSTAERPSEVPEKFWDAKTGQVKYAEWAKAHTELERRFHTEPKDKPSEGAEPKPDDLKIEAAPDVNETPVAKAMASFRTAYEESNGEVSEDHLAEISKVVPREYVEIYLAGVKALEAQQVQTAYAAAGGEDKFKAASKWAAQNMGEEDLNSYNSLISNPATAKQGVEWLMAKFSAARPSEGSFIQAESAGVGDVFRDRKELIAAMNDPRYESQPSYRTDVAEKMARSKAAGTL